MVNSDPKRTPSFTLFGDDDFFFQIGERVQGAGTRSGRPPSASTRASPGTTATTRTRSATPGSAWSGPVSTAHGDRQHDLERPRRPAPDDQRAARPAGQLHRRRPRRRRRFSTIEPSRRGSTTTPSTKLGASYKQINAPFGQFADDTLVASTAALKTSDALKYESIETAIANLTLTRNVLAGEIRQALNDASSGNGRIDDDQARAWIKRAQNLLDQAHALAVANPAS